MRLGPAHGRADALSRQVDPRAVVSDSLVSPEYLAIAASAGESRKHLDELIKTTAGQQGISGSEIKRMPVPLPPFDEQQRIVTEVSRQLSAVRRTEAEIETTLGRADSFRRASLATAFSVPPDVDR